MALNRYLLPDLKRIGVQPVVETIAAQTSETAATNSDASLDVEKLRAAGVDSLIPLMPFNAFLPVLGAQTQQQYFPRLLLSDYEDSIEASLGLIPCPFQKALNGQEGVTTETLGGIDDPRPQAQGGYDPGVRACWVTWHKAYPQTPKGNINDFIEEQGPVQGWARRSGSSPKRRRRPARISPAGPSLRRCRPSRTTGRLLAPPHLRAGQVLRTLRVPGREPAREQTTLAQCRLPEGTLPPQVVCWHQVQSWKPLPKSS